MTGTNIRSNSRVCYFFSLSSGQLTDLEKLYLDALWNEERAAKSTPVEQGPEQQDTQELVLFENLEAEWSENHDQAG